ncbi:hypothetical protein PanWU01x14_234990 [Parasponia andersonii]|uniref:Uncharacterized protein n=1 Tax=Parasponia andersonii TaxID=3476 RepID=A0A2P5BJ58_PARAD|nr:hypothetical protein PanWU01x14_234990 [Parasponia andersonii]
MTTNKKKGRYRGTNFNQKALSFLLSSIFFFLFWKTKKESQISLHIQFLHHPPRCLPHISNHFQHCHGPPPLFLHCLPHKLL